MPKLAKTTQAHGRGRRRPAARCAPSSSSASPNRSRPRCATPTAARSPSRWTAGARAPVLGEVRVPDLQLLAAGARAAAVLVQQPDGRVPALRRPRHRSASSIRSASSRFRSCRSRRARSRAGTGATSSTSRCCSASRSTSASTSTGRSRSCPSACRTSILYGSGDEKIPFTYLSERGKPIDARARVRGHHPEPRAPLSRDRLGDGARGAREVPQQQAVPRMRRHAAAARGAPRQGRRRRRRARDLRDLGAAAQGDDGVLPRADARRPEGRDRRQDRQGDRQPARSS